MKCQKVMWRQNPPDAAASGQSVAIPHFFRDHIWDQMFSRTFDPDNRLVARGLEAEWENALRELKAAEAELARREHTKPLILTAEDRAALLALGKDLNAVWSAPTTTDR